MATPSLVPSPADPASLHQALLESLYCDMLVLADEVRAEPPAFDEGADAAARVRIACEHLRLSARLMRMTQLLLDHRAGRPVPAQAVDGLSAPLDDGPLPPLVREHLDAASRLEVRLAELVAPPPPAPPAVLDLHRRLARNFG
jgi:hypothetical protein